jgi:hypothetical protein
MGKARAELSSLIPLTCGDVVPLDGTGRGKVDIPPAITPSEPWPDFLRQASLVVKPGTTDVLQLLLLIDQELVSGRWRVCSVSTSDPGEPFVFWDGDGAPPSPELRVDLVDSRLSQLLLDREVLVIWKDCAQGRAFPLNVSQDARVHLPIAPGAGLPSEQQLVAYYQGKISWEGLFGSPESEGPQEPSPRSLVRVDTDGIQAYQVRAFVEGLHGMRSDILASAVSPGSIWLALLGPISPVALARAISNTVTSGKRSAVAAGFQLTEILCCLQDVETFTPPRYEEDWRKYLQDAKAAVLDLLRGLDEGHTAQLASAPAYRKYQATVGQFYAQGRSRS